MVITQIISYAQMKAVTVSGLVKDKAAGTALPFVNIVVKTGQDSAFVMGTVTNEEGRFSLSSISKYKGIIYL